MVAFLMRGVNRPKGFDEPLKRLIVSQPKLFSHMRIKHIKVTLRFFADE